MLRGLYGSILDCFNRLNFYAHKVKMEKSIKTYGIIHLKKDKNAFLSIKDNTIIRSHWRNNPAGGGQRDCLIAVVNGGILEIGRNVGISNSSIYCKNHITIEDDVYIGVNSVIYDTDFHSIYADKRINGNTEIKSAPVIIGRGAWIGGHCIILKGVSIGERAVVGAGSVVTHDIPSDEIWAGNPAKFIKRINQ